MAMSFAVGFRLCPDPPAVRVDLAIGAHALVENLAHDPASAFAYFGCEPPRAPQRPNTIRRIYKRVCIAMSKKFERARFIDAASLSHNGRSPRGISDWVETALRLLLTLVSSGTACRELFAGGRRETPRVNTARPAPEPRCQSCLAGSTGFVDSWPLAIVRSQDHQRELGACIPARCRDLGRRDGRDVPPTVHGHAEGLAFKGGHLPRTSWRSTQLGQTDGPRGRRRAHAPIVSGAGCLHPHHITTRASPLGGATGFIA
nr:hypothetical protein CFP56_79245 [Quercus suber]